MNADDDDDDGLMLDQQATRTHPSGNSGPMLADVHPQHHSDANSMEKEKRLLVAVTCLSIVSSWHDHFTTMIVLLLAGNVQQSARAHLSISRTKYAHSIVIHAVARDDQSARLSSRYFSQFLSLPVVRRIRPSSILSMASVRLGSMCAVYSVYRAYRSVLVFVCCPSRRI